MNIQLKLSYGLMHYWSECVVPWWRPYVWPYLPEVYLSTATLYVFRQASMQICRGAMVTWVVLLVCGTLHLTIWPVDWLEVLVGRIHSCSICCSTFEMLYTHIDSLASSFCVYCCTSLFKCVCHVCIMCLVSGKGLYRSFHIKIPSTVCVWNDLCWWSGFSSGSV